MKTVITYRSVNVTLSDMYEGSREASYQFEGEEPVMVECGDVSDLQRIVYRAIDDKLDPSKIQDADTRTTEGKQEQEQHEGEGQGEYHS